MGKLIRIWLVKIAKNMPLVLMWYVTLEGQEKVTSMSEGSLI